MPLHRASSIPSSSSRSGRTLHVVKPGIQGEPAGAVRGVTSEDAKFTASLRGLREKKSIYLEVDAGNDGYWRLEFEPPGDSTLGVGTFRRAQRLSFKSPEWPRMDVGGNHRGCNKLWGSFEIDELKRAGDELQPVELSFVQRCRTPDGPAMHGRIRYRNPDFEDEAGARAQNVVSVNPHSLVGRWLYANGSGEGYILVAGDHISLSLHHRPSNRFYHFLGQQIGSSISGQWVAVGEPGEAGTAILKVQESGQRLEVTQSTGGTGLEGQAFIKIR